jgi:hypothetical protein
MGTQHTVRGKFSRWMGTVVIRVESPPSTGGEEAAGLREIRPARYSVEMRCPSGYSDIFIPDRNASRPLANNSSAADAVRRVSFSLESRHLSFRGAGVVQVWWSPTSLAAERARRAPTNPQPSSPTPPSHARILRAIQMPLAAVPAHSGVIPAHAPEAVWSANSRVPELLSVSSKGRVACHG